MTRYLPPNLLVLFASRDPIEFISPVERRKMPPYTGLSQYIKFFDDPKIEPPPPVPQTLTKEERRAKKRKEKQEQELEKIKEQLKSWDPHNNPKATDDAFKSLFVGRISYKTTEHKLKREFEQYGPIKAVRMVYDLDGKPRGYAFIEYERERDMRTAYKEGDAKKIDGRRVLVDVERGRTVKGWKPRRFGGGLGGTRIGGDRENIKFSGRAPPSREDRGGSGDLDRHTRRPEDFAERDRGTKRSRDERDDGRDRDRERNVRPRTESKYEGHDYNRREDTRRDEGRRDERRRSERGGERFREEREDRGHEDDRHRRHYR